jgi:putative endonuclease
LTYYTYILKSKVASKTYVGHTGNIERRLNEHNNGEGCFSRRFRPWKIIYLEEFDNKKESAEKEKFFKSKAGRRWIKEHLFA